MSMPSISKITIVVSSKRKKYIFIWFIRSVTTCVCERERKSIIKLLLVRYSEFKITVFFFATNELREKAHIDIKNTEKFLTFNQMSTKE